MKISVYWLVFIYHLLSFYLDLMENFLSYCDFLAIFYDQLPIKKY